MTFRAGITGDETSGRVTGALWIAAALLLCLSVLILNGRPLFYFDTIGYIDQGQSILEKLNILPPPEAPAVSADTTAPAAAPAAPPAEPKDKTVDGSRSIFFSILMGGLAALGTIEVVNLLNAAAIILALWLPLRVASRLHAAPFGVPAMIAMAVAAAALGSMPFFVAYLMPDTMAPVMILAIATVAAFGRRMTWGELLLAFVLGAGAIVSHLSHFAIAGGMLVAAVGVALVLRRGTWGVTVVFVLALLAVAYAQQVAIRAAASKVASSEVVIRPFLTARLIQDGPGYDYLAARCPDPAYATCKLYAELQKGSDPWRLTASHILFKQSPDLGSLRLMPVEDQVAVARDQTQFFRDVLMNRPVATTLAFVRNTLIQTVMFSVDMTFQNDSTLKGHEGVKGPLTGTFADGRLTRGDDGWIGSLTVAHGAFYAVCLVVALAILIRPGGLPVELRAFAVLLLLGILANAFVCGGISQPASRYGARMIWLLPVAAVILVLFRNARVAR